MRFFKSSLFAAFLCLSSVLFAQSAGELEPGIAAPDTGTVFALDPSASGSTLKSIHPTEISSNSHAASNFARSMVYAGPHRGVELQGAKADTVFAAWPHAFYVRVGVGDEADIMRNRVALVALNAKKDRREVFVFTQNIFGGQAERHAGDVPVTKTDVHGGWLKMVPDAALEPGEYGIVFMPKDARSFPELVYDFSVAGAPSKKK